jgi:hypothetical protein
VCARIRSIGYNRTISSSYKNRNVKSSITKQEIPISLFSWLLLKPRHPTRVPRSEVAPQFRMLFHSCLQLGRRWLYIFKLGMGKEYSSRFCPLVYLCLLHFPPSSLPALIYFAASCASPPLPNKSAMGEAYQRKQTPAHPGAPSTTRPVSTRRGILASTTIIAYCKGEASARQQLSPPMSSPSLDWWLHGR